MAVFRETQNGSTSITVTQPNSLFMTIPSNGWTLGSDASSGQTYHRQVICAMLARAQYAREKIESLYRSLAGIAAQALALRDLEALELASEIMLGLPVSSHAKNIARYYQAFLTNENGEFETARERLDQLLEQELDPRLRSRALLTKAATYFDAGEIDRSLSFYVEAGQVARDYDSVSLVESLRQIAIIKSIHGDHHRALADLESLLPIVCRISRHDPQAYCALLNSLAVELGEVGQTDQALNLVSRVAAFSSVVPEINETIVELQSKRPTRKHSVVVIHRPTEPLIAQAKPNLKAIRATPFAFAISEADRCFTSYRAPPAAGVRLTKAISVSNPARQPAKARAP